MSRVKCCEVAVWAASQSTIRIIGENQDFSPTIADYNPAVVRRAKAESVLSPFKGAGTIRERGSDAWFPVEFLIYHNNRGRLVSFTYVRRQDGCEIPDGHYFFLDDIGERTFRWRKWKGMWQFGWRHRGQ
jgi:hypothetical protein